MDADGTVNTRINICMGETLARRRFPAGRERGIRRSADGPREGAS